MCLILVRNPEVSLPYDAIKNACLNNPHGWGYIIPDRGQLEVRRYFSPKGNDPDQVYDVLDTHLDKQIFLHLRFCTAGDKNKENVHPFPVLQTRKHGMQAWLMHNGTVSDYRYSNSNKSDTAHFCHELVSPLLQRVMHYTGKKGCIKDPFVSEIIKKVANNWSKFLLVDQYGNYTIIGESDAKDQEEGYWVSNDYSFRPSYRTPPSKTESYSSTNYHYQGSYKNPPFTPDTYKAVEAEFEDADDRSERDLPFGACPTTGSTSGLPVVAEKKVASETWPPEEPLNLDDRTKFLELLGMEKLSELCLLTQKDILDMVNEYPEVMAVLICDLLVELYGDK